MKKIFDRALIATDFSPMDNQLMSFFSQFKKLTDNQVIYLVHIIPNFTNPQNKDLEFHKLFVSGYPIDEKVKDLLDEKAKEYFDEKDDITIDVVEGKPYKTLLHWIDHKEIGLVVLGKKQKSANSGITSKRIIRNISTNVLIVPEKSTLEIENIVVPIDFSANSARALQSALEFKKRSKIEVEVTGLHIIQMLMTDHYYGLSLNPKFQNMLTEAAQKSFNDFIEKYDFDEKYFQIKYEFNVNNNAATHIGFYLDKNETDLLIIGAQGHSAFERFLVGSTTEQLVENIPHIPILIIR